MDFFICNNFFEPVFSVFNFSKACDIYFEFFFQRRQEELERRAQELERREAELRNAPTNGNSNFLIQIV